MDSLILALQFLTVLPLKIRKFSEKKMASSMIFFPVSGLFLGLFLSGIGRLLLMLNFSPLALSIILVVALVILTGGMHLDGLSDTADAFFSGRPREEMLEIMRDSHIGVMGVLSLVSVMLLKIGFLFSVSAALKTTALLLMCVLSRWSAVLAMFLFEYARMEGKAKVFIRGINLKVFLSSLAMVILLAFAIWRLKGLLVLAIVAGCAYLLGSFSRRKIGGITGDTLGATIELTETVVLFIMCIG